MVSYPYIPLCLRLPQNHIMRSFGLLVGLCAVLHAIVVNGTSVCYVGYIMDRYCIDRGVLLDKPTLSTLENPNRCDVAFMRGLVLV